jgi:tRNA nucleotidyltransferase (CCA-adding enzyme)
MKTFEALKALDRETKAKVFIVGGFVRDLVRRKKNHDLDVVVRNLSMRSIEKFLSKYGKTKKVKLSKTNDNFTVGILLFKASGHDLEAQITLPKRGAKQIPDSHNTLEQDVKHRDFRLNALYLPINYKSRNDIVDLVGGRADIARRRITANGNAEERIKESPIRMMRAISLASRTNYRIDKGLLRAIKKHSALINKCPAEIIRVELDKIIMGRKPSKYFKLMQKTGLLKHVCPELENCVGVKQDSRYHKYDVFRHLIYTLDHCDNVLSIRLAGLLHDVGKPATKKEQKKNGEQRISFHKHEMVSIKLARDFLKRLKYDSKTAKEVLLLVRYHMYHYTREWNDATIRRFIKRVGIGEEYMTEEKISTFPLFRLRAAERLGNGLKDTAVTSRQTDFEKRLVKAYHESNGLETTDLDLNGHRIMEVFKIPQGQQVGDILKFLLDNVLEKPELNNELELLKLTTEYLYNGK